jgi:hypothetical protein
LVWKMEAAEKASLDVANNGKIFGLENGSSIKGWMGLGKQREYIWFGKWKQQKRLDGT